MPPKQQVSKKAQKEKKDRAVEDLTFGLKNKNKSSKVQKFIDNVQKTVRNSGDAKDVAKAKEAKKEAKLVQQLQEEELRILFNEGISGQFGKKKTKTAALAKELGISDVNKELQDIIETQFGSDSDDDDDDDSDNDDDRRRINGDLVVDDEPAAVEVFREKTIEDIIEEQRAKLAAEGKTGTPVTADSFARWKAAKIIRKQAEAEAKVLAEQAKKKGGRGLSVLTGKELFSYNSALFVDDDGAIDASEEDAMNQETKASMEAEERRAEEESQRAQAEQIRLAEAERIEQEVREAKVLEWRAGAEAPNRVTFKLGGVIINEIVFELDEKEDLTPFHEKEPVTFSLEEGNSDDELISSSISMGNIQLNDCEQEVANSDAVDL